MEKNTLLAVVLSVAVLFGFYIVQGILFPAPPPQPAAPPVGEIPQPVPPPPPVPFAVAPETALGVPAFTGEETEGVAVGFEQLVHIETDLLSVELSNAGGNIVSFRLNQHMDGDQPVEMIFRGDGGSHAFTLAFGPPNTQPETSLFHVERISDHTVRFYRDFPLPHDPSARFWLEKEYRFFPGEYMFELVVRLRADQMMNFDFGGMAYTLSFGPQIGPAFQRLDRHQNFRQYFIFDGRRRRTERANDSIISPGPRWAAIAGQYFTLIAIPALPGGFSLSFSERMPEPGLPSVSRMHILRPPLTSSRTDDVFRFYLGPRRLNTLQAYDRGDSAIVGVSGLQLTEMAGSRGFLAPLERVLLWFLMLFHGLTGNYGIAIIMLTLLVRLAFFPLTKKGSEATLRMQAIAPKIKELQTKYKDNRQKMNAEMAELYKKEGYNPLKGCLPMLLQLPIFLAMFNLFRTHFELRGAMFIPGWIPDLSVPEYIWAFPEGIQLPLLGWDAFRLLPFIYVGSQLLYGRVTQTPDQKANPQMKMLLYIMPIVFFFILYDMPSGLLVYWTSSNVLTMIQQVTIMRYLAKKKAAQAAAAPPPVIASPQKKNSGTIVPPRKRKKR